MAIDLTLNYSSGEFLEPKKKTGNLGERFKLAELDNFNTPDLEQSPDSFLRPGETLEDWDVSFRRPNAKGGLQRKGLRSGTATLPYLTRGWSRPGVHKAWTKEKLAEHLLDAGAVGASGTLAFRDRKPKEEVKETIITKKKKDLIEPPEGPEGPDILDVVETVMTAKEIKDTFDKQKILYDQKKMQESAATTNKEFAQKVADFIDTKHGGRVEAAVKDILGVTEKTKEVENLRVRINSLFKNREIERGTRTGNIKPLSNIDITYDEKVTWPDLTTNISKDKNYLRGKIKKFIKEGKLNPNKSYSLQQLADAFGVEFKNKSESNNMGWILGNKLKNDIRTYKVGKYPYYHLGDTLKALQNRYGGGQKKIAGTIKGGPQKYAFNKSFDPKASEIISTVQARIVDRSRDADIYDEEAVPHWQHVESRHTMGKYPNVFRDSNIKTLQTFTLGHPGVNVDIMTKKGFEGKKSSIYKELNKLIGKKANKENIEVWKKLSDRMNDVYIDVYKEIEEMKKDPEVGDSYIGAEKTVAPIKIRVPKIGEKFRSQDVYADMSNVEEIMGDIQDINPFVKKLSDLSEEEQATWRENLIQQYMDHLTDFYKEVGYDDEDLETFKDWIYEGDISAGAKGAQPLIVERASGGPVVPTIPYRENFESGSEPENKMSDEDILDSIRKGVFELEQNWNTEKSIPGKILDVADTSNWPYYAARMLRAGMSVAEISAKLPFVSMELLGKLATQPAFKVKKADTTQSVAELGMGEKFMEGADDSWLTDQPQKKLEGTGLFTEAFKKLMPDKFAEKTGLNSLIESQEQAMQDKGMSQWPEIAGKNIEMGLDITLPFGYVAAANKYKSLKKLLTPLVKDKNVNKVIEEALTGQGMSRREFNTLIASGGMIAAIKALGLDSLFKGARGAKELKAAPIQMLKNSSTKMPVWFPKFIDEINKKMTYEGSGMYTFKGTDDFLPGFHIERISDDYYITGKNDYGQEFQVTYESPKWEGDKDGSFYNEGEFRVDDAEPVHMDPDGNVDFDGVVRDDIDEVLGGTSAMEDLATGTTRKNLTKGEEKVLDAEGRAQSNYDMAKDEGYFDDVE